MFNQKGKIKMVPFLTSLVIVGGLFLFTVFGDFLFVSPDRTIDPVAEKDDLTAKTAQEKDILSKIVPIDLGKMETVDFLATKGLAEGKGVYINLETMRLFLYEDGDLFREFAVQSKGRPGSLWETPPGDYKVMFKNQNHFSSISSVYMPYSVHFFGNFFIHGTPYYPGGQVIDTEFSGGCIRVSTEDARELFAFVEKGTAVHVSNGGFLSVGELLEFEEQKYFILDKDLKSPEISASSYLVVDLDSEDVILEKSSSKKVFIDDLSNLITTITSVETVNQHRHTTVQEIHAKLGNPEAEKLSTGESVLIADLIFPLLFTEGTIASETVARYRGRSAFVDLMNSKAKSVGLYDTRFSNPGGKIFGQERNISTARDIYTFLVYAYRHKDYLLDLTRHSRRTNFKGILNQNPFINQDGFLGGKVSQDEDEQAAVIFSTSLVYEENGNERKIVIVLIDSDDSLSDVQEIKKYLAENIAWGERRAIEKYAIKQFNLRERAEEIIHMTFVGDIMLDRGLLWSLDNFADGDFDFFFQKVTKLKESDILFGNLEGPVSDKGRDGGSLYSFRMPPKVLDSLKKAGFNVLSIANNHMGDWGREAFVDTVDRLKKYNILHPGGGYNLEEARTAQTIKIKGQTFGFLGFTDVGPNWLEATAEEPGMLLASDRQFSDIVARAAGEVDLLIVSFHFGEEYQNYPQARQRTLAEGAIDAGATIVAGHHPHVIQPVEEYRDGLIAFSLGNFIFDQYFSEETMQGLVLHVYVLDGDIISYETEISRQNETYQPSLE